MSQFLQHPLSAAFPRISDEDLNALTEDIMQHGQHEPGVIFEDKVLDGWHRYLACERAGVEFKTYRLNGEDPVAFVLSHNLHRRHLTATQRAQAVVEVNQWAPTGRPGKGCSAAPFPEKHNTVKEMAKKADVSQRTIKQVKKANGVDPKLGDAMREGALSAERAAEISELPPAKREKALKEPRPPKKSKKPALDPEAEKHAPNLADELERADKQIREQQELIDSLTKDDHAKEVAKWKLKYDQLNGRVQQLATTTAEAKKTAQYQADLLAKIRKALKVQKNGEILQALKR